MKAPAHISAMEAILEEHGRVLSSLHTLLDELARGREDYQRLLDYYYSELRQQDLEDDAQGRIAPHLKRGVLSEDAIYNLMADNYACCMQMLELSVAYLRGS